MLQGHWGPSLFSGLALVSRLGAVGVLSAYVGTQLLLTSPFWPLATERDQHLYSDGTFRPLLLLRECDCGEGRNRRGAAESVPCGGFGKFAWLWFLSGRISGRPDQTWVFQRYIGWSELVRLYFTLLQVCPLLTVSIARSLVIFFPGTETTNTHFYMC